MLLLLTDSWALTLATLAAGAAAAPTLAALAAAAAGHFRHLPLTLALAQHLVLHLAALASLAALAAGHCRLPHLTLALVLHLARLHVAPMLELTFIFFCFILLQEVTAAAM